MCHYTVRENGMTCTQSVCVDHEEHIPSNRGSDAMAWLWYCGHAYFSKQGCLDPCPPISFL